MRILITCVQVIPALDLFDALADVFEAVAGFF